MFEVKFECAITGETITEVCYTEWYAINYAAMLRKDPRVKNVRVVSEK